MFGEQVEFETKAARDSRFGIAKNDAQVLVRKSVEPSPAVRERHSLSGELASA